MQNGVRSIVKGRSSIGSEAKTRDTNHHWLPARARREQRRRNIVGRALSVIMISWLMAGISILPAAAENSAPHNSANNISCGSCHAQTLLNSPFWGSTDPENYDKLCLLNCHLAVSAPYSDTWAPKIKTHSSNNTSTQYGSWASRCVSCHNPHLHEQVQWLRSNSTSLYLVSGKITGYSWDAVSKTSTLNTTGVAWKTGWNAAMVLAKTSAERRAVLLPNIRKTGFSFPVIAVNDPGPNSIRVKGNVTSVFSYSALPTDFAIIYGQYIKQYITAPNSSVYPVKFFDATAAGSSGFTDQTGVVPPKGICQVCHTKTSYWRSDGSRQSHFTNRACPECHPHAEGFKPGCDGCHGNPPVINTAQAKDGLVVTPSATGSSSAGAHSVHATASGYNFSCDTCHYSGMPATAISSNNKLQMGFSMVRGNINKDGSGTVYDGRVVLSAPYTYEGTNGTSVTSGGSLTCANTYCHSNGLSIGWGSSLANTSTAWNWAGGAAGDPQGDTNKCNNCHPQVYWATYGDDHELHRSRGLTCNWCHYSVTTNGTTITDKSKHVNGIYDLAPDPNAKWNGTSYFRFDYVFAPQGGSCNNNTCHVAAGWPGGRDKQWNYFTKINGNFSYTANDCGAAPADPATITATITPSAGIAPYKCKVDWGDVPGLNFDGIPWGNCSVSHTYTGGRGLYTVRWSVQDAAFNVLTPPDPRTVNISPCNQAPSPATFQVAGGPLAAALYDLVVTSDATDPDYNWGTHSGPGAIYIDWDDGGTTSSNLNLTNTPSSQQFSHTYAAGGYTFVTVYVKDNATADSRYQCWQSRRCTVFVDRAMSETPFTPLPTDCGTPAHPADCLP